jgi:hypothetical protein
MLRIGCDLDGTLADLATAYQRVAANVHSDSDAHVWDTIRTIENFWMGLEPLESDVIHRLYEASRQAQWEIFFITQRPNTVGESVQRQTQHWLIKQGFESPSVLTVPGNRGKAALALELDYLIDDLPRNCIDVAAESRCHPLLVCRHPDPDAESTAARFKISVTRSVGEAIDFIHAALPSPQTQETGSRWLRKLGLA